MADLMALQRKVVTHHSIQHLYQVAGMAVQQLLLEFLQVIQVDQEAVHLTMSPQVEQVTQELILLLKAMLAAET